MKIICILFLSIIINSNISGLTGIVLKQLSLSNRMYNYVHVIMNAIILLLSYYLLNKISFWNHLLFPIINYKILYIVLLVPLQLYIDYRLLYNRFLYTAANKKPVYRLPRRRGTLVIIGSMEELSYRVIILGTLLYMTNNDYFIAVIVTSGLYTLNHLYLIRNSHRRFNLVLSKMIFGIFAAMLTITAGIVSAIFFHLLYNIIILFGFGYIFKKEVTNG